jgi:hypothetical protein
VSAIDQLTLDSDVVRDRVRAMRDEAVNAGVAPGELDEALGRANLIDGDNDRFSELDLGALEQAVGDRRHDMATRNRPGSGPGLSLPSTAQLIDQTVEQRRRDAALAKTVPGLTADIISTAQPARPAYGAAQAGTELRNLAANGITSTSYWGRVSPNGEMFAIGSNRGVSVVDLRPGQTNAVHFRQGSYDPTFGDDALYFQGGGTWRVGMDWLRNNPPENVTGEVPGGVTRATSLALYQDVMGSDRSGFALDGHLWAGDPAPSTRDPRVSGSATASVRVHALAGLTAGNDRNTQTIATPFHSGWQMSHDGRHMVSQIVDPASPNNQLGYAIYGVSRNDTGTVELTPVRVVSGLRGGKPKMGGDYLAFHHAVTAADFAHYGFASADDPRFQELLRRGTADIYLYDIRDNTVRRATNAGPGNLAWYPSFATNADGTLRVVYVQRNTDRSNRVMSINADAPATTPAQ